MRTITILSAVLLAAAVPPASAQDQHGMAASSEQVTLPAACEAAAGSMDMSKMMGGMQNMMSGGQMNEAQKGNMDAMMQTQGPMMKTMSISDPDLAFNCGMIVHHQGAIAMAEVELKLGQDEKSKQMAQKIIDDQKREIEEMTARVEALAK